MVFALNDKVRELNDTGEGIVTELIDQYRVKVLFNDGFERVCSCTSLVKIAKNLDEESWYGIKEGRMDQVLINELTEELAHREKRTLANKTGNRARMKGVDMEVDLHIENLLDSHRNMTNGEIIQVQLNVFESSLKRAMSKRMRKIVFIHGVGQGVLRSEIRRLLKDYYPNTEFYDANYRQYGVGGTEVLVRYH